MEIKGSIKVLKATREISEKFKLRELVITTEDTYPQDVPIQFTNIGCELLDKFKVGDNVDIEFNIKGKEWADPKSGEVKYFATIQGYKIFKSNDSVKPQATQPTQSVAIPPNISEDDELPF